MSEPERADDPLPSGTRLGPYVLGSPLGAGGMGVVYRARDERLARDVAVKVLPPQFCVPDRLARFITEARATAALSHPNVLAIFDVAQEGTQPYLVTELLEGKPLDQVVEGGPVPARRAVELAVQVARGLSAAHEHGIVHRDLKPSNLFVTRDGLVKILDFGLAKVVGPPSTPFGDTHVPSAPSAGTPKTMEGAIVGTVGYMAPEQLEGRPADARSDLFSFGCVLHELLSGQRPFGTGSGLEVASRILRDEPAPLPASVPPPLARLCLRCLEKDPTRRFQSARDLAFALEMLEAPSSPGGTAVAPSPQAAGAIVPPNAVVTRSGRRMPLVAGLVAMFALGLGAALVVRAPARASSADAHAGSPHFTQLTYRLGWIGAAKFAPGGASVIFGATVDRSPQVFSAIPGSSESRALTPKGSELMGVSPQGELALLVNDKSGKRVLARAGLSGGAPRAIADDVLSASWAADGNDLVLARKVDGAITVEYPPGHVLAESHAARVLATMSPKGDVIAFAELLLPSYATGRIELLGLDGKRRPLTGTLPDLGSLTWTPDGRELWFTSAAGHLAARTINAVDLEGRTRTVFESPVPVALKDIGPDGRVLLSTVQFHHRISGVLGGTGYERDLSWFEDSDQPVLSADGKQLLSTVFGEAAGPTNAVYWRESPEDAAVRLAEGNALALSPDGRWALVGAGKMLSDLSLVPTGPGTSRPLPADPLTLVTAAFWFPDGQRVLVMGREQDRGLRAWMLALSGGPPKPLTAEGVLVSCPPSPDGAWLAAITPEKQPVLVAVAGGAIKPLEGLPAGYLPIGWTEGGHGLFVRKLEGVDRLDGYVSTATPVVIERYDLKTHQRTPWRELVPGEPAGASHIDNVAISPDGRSYAFAYATRAAVLFSVEGLH